MTTYTPLHFRGGDPGSVLTVRLLRSEILVPETAVYYRTLQSIRLTKEHLCVFDCGSLRPVGHTPVAPVTVSTPTSSLDRRRQR